MPGKLIPGEKKTPIYKKSSGFKMKGYSYPGTSPMQNNELTDKEKQENLLKVVPNEQAFNELSPEDRKGFTEAWIKSGGVTKEVLVKKEENNKGRKQ